MFYKYKLDFFELLFNVVNEIKIIIYNLNIFKKHYANINGLFLFSQDDSNRTILSEKKFSKEIVHCCVTQTRDIESLEELLGKC